MQCSLKIVLFLLSSLWVFAGCDALKELEEQTGSVELEPVDPVRETVLAAPSRNYVHEMLVTPPEGEWPDPLPTLTWWETLEEGWAEVRKEGRPLLVLVQCPVHRVIWRTN